MAGLAAGTATLESFGMIGSTTPQAGTSDTNSGSGLTVVPTTGDSAVPSVTPVAFSPTKPSSAEAPWYVPQRIDALNSAQRDGFAAVFGDYNERSEDPSYVRFQAASKELGNPRQGAFATYTGLDLGDGIETLMVRVSVPTGTSAIEIRKDSIDGAMAGPICTLPTTGSSQAYRTVSCAVDPSVARGRNQTLVLRVVANNPALRLNWFGFWARNTVQQIDTLGDIQNDADRNRPTENIIQAGTPTRTRDLLPDETKPQSRTFGQWTPTQIGDCPKWLHDTYWVEGDDNKVYPTWHPAVDYNPDTGAYCTFGHEHGTNPRASRVFQEVGMPAFGYVSENHEPSTIALQRREDHFGYKVLVANNFDFYDARNTADIRKCSVLIAIHVGTHSADAFTNTAHETLTAGKCDGLESFKVRQFHLFGPPGMFREAEAEGCSAFIASGLLFSPSNQPTGGVHRSGPTAACFLRGTPADQIRLTKRRLIEYWLTGFFGGSLYYTIGNPSRHFDGARPDRLGRNVDLCYVPGHPLQSTLECQETVAASRSQISFDDPRSSFRGSIHSNTHFSALKFDGSPTRVVYTNAWGQNPSRTPDPTRGITIPQTLPTVAFYLRSDGAASRIPNVDHSSGGRNGVRSPN